MKTKETILDEKPYDHTKYGVMIKRDDCLEAIDEFTKQESEAFAEWLYKQTKENNLKYKEKDIPGLYTIFKSED